MLNDNYKAFSFSASRRVVAHNTHYAISLDHMDTTDSSDSFCGKLRQAGRGNWGGRGMWRQYLVLSRLPIGKARKGREWRRNERTRGEGRRKEGMREGSHMKGPQWYAARFVVVPRCRCNSKGTEFAIYDDSNDPYGLKTGALSAPHLSPLRMRASACHSHRTSPRAPSSGKPRRELGIISYKKKALGPMQLEVSTA